MEANKSKKRKIQAFDSPKERIKIVGGVGIADKFVGTHGSVSCECEEDCDCIYSCSCGKFVSKTKDENGKPIDEKRRAELLKKHLKYAIKIFSGLQTTIKANPGDEANI
jgi:hypothetical protein